MKKSIVDYLCRTADIAYRNNKKYVSISVDTLNKMLLELEQIAPVNVKPVYKLDRTDYMGRCGKCGWPIASDESYCSRCGRKINWTEYING